MDNPTDLLNKANDVVFRHKETQKDQLNHVNYLTKYLFYNFTILFCNSGFILGAATKGNNESNGMGSL